MVYFCGFVWNLLNFLIEMMEYVRLTQQRDDNNWKKCRLRDTHSEMIRGYICHNLTLTARVTVNDERIQFDLFRCLLFVC